MRDLPLFTYGTMLDDDVLELVLDRRIARAQRRRATLRGYRRVRLPDESYPILAPAPGQEVHGELLSGLSAHEWERLSFFESAEYDFSTCEVFLPDGAPTQALHCAEADVEPGATEEWGLAWWQLNHKARYLHMSRHFMAVFGRGTREDAEAVWEALSLEPEPGGRVVGRNEG